MFWGQDFNCEKQQMYHTTSVVFMILCSTFALLHLWVCLRFSEKLQSWEDADEYDVDVNLGDKFRCICWINQPMKLYKFGLIFLALAVITGGGGQIYYGVESDGSDQVGHSYLTDDFPILDSPSYIDTPIIYGIFSILSALFTFVFACTNSRSMLSLVYCLLVESIAIGWQNCLWHEIDLEYGIIQWAEQSINIYPVYINGEARDMLWACVQWYWASLGASILMLFFCVMTHEAIQDVDKIVNNDTDKWSVKIGPNSVKF